MKEIVVMQANGKALKVSQPAGSDGVWHIYIDTLYQGQVVPQYGGGLRICLNGKSKLTDQHKMMIVAAIERDAANQF
jgi:hypothetical protein